MTIDELPISGAYVVRGTRHQDDRGDFRELLNAQSIADLRITWPPSQIASAHNLRRGTVRGLHYQVEPFPESKILWCGGGAAFDVLVDLRPNQPTYGRWTSIALGSEALAVHVPPGVAHGYQTLADNTTLNYLIYGTRDLPSSRTLLWNDPQLGIDWPLAATTISAKDREATPWPPQS